MQQGQQSRRSGRRDIEFRDQDPIGGHDLVPRFLVPFELPDTGLRIDDGHHGRDANRIIGGRIVVEAPEDGGRLGDAGRFQHDDIGTRAVNHVGERRPQLALHADLVTDTSAGQLENITGARTDQARVDVDASQLVDQHRDATVVLGTEHTVQDRGLSGAEKSGQHDQRYGPRSASGRLRHRRRL